MSPSQSVATGPDGPSWLPAPLLAVLTAILLAVAGYGGGNVLAVAVVSVLFVLGIELEITHLLVVSVISIQLVAFTAVSLLYLGYRGYSVRDIGVVKPTLEDWIVLAAGFVGTIVLWLAAAVASFLVSSRFGIEQEQQEIIELGQQDPTVFLLLGVLSLLVIGPAEELLFRGVIQTRLRETFGVVTGLTLATALFAVIHLPGFLGSIGGAALGVSVLFVVGTVLAVTYEYTGNLVVPAVIHGLFNATQAAFGYLGVRYGGEEFAGAAVEAGLFVAAAL